MSGRSRGRRAGGEGGQESIPLFYFYFILFLKIELIG